MQIIIDRMIYDPKMPFNFLHNRWLEMLQTWYFQRINSEMAIMVRGFILDRAATLSKKLCTSDVSSDITSPPLEKATKRILLIEKLTFCGLGANYVSILWQNFQLRFSSIFNLINIILLLFNYYFDKQIIF